MTLQFPPENYHQVPSAVAGIDVFAPQPEPSAPEAPVVDFHCPRCGAATAYSLDEGGIKCAHCGYFEAPQAEIVGKGAQEFEFKAETMVQAALGWGEERNDLVCQNCGAVTSLPAGSLSAACPFCSSNKVFQRSGAQGLLRPRFILPFARTPAEAGTIAAKWLGSSWMAPAVLKQGRRLDDFKPVYIPFWTFDSTAAANWEADVGYNETERYYDPGSKEWKSRTVIRWRREGGRAGLDYDDVLVPGTARLSSLHLSKIDDFDLTGLAVYSPEYLAGIHAQAYEIPLEASWETGRSRMRESTRAACREQIRGDHVRNFRMSLDFSGESWRYVLLPVLINAFRFQGQTYRILVNGQTGAISGQRPVDWTKVWLAISACLVPGGLTTLAGVLLLIFAPVGPLVALAGFFLLILGFAAAWFIYRAADREDDI